MLPEPGAWQAVAEDRTVIAVHRLAHLRPAMETDHAGILRQARLGHDESAPGGDIKRRRQTESYRPAAGGPSIEAGSEHNAAAFEDFPADAFEAASVLETVAAERCTALHGVPTMFIAELEHPEFERFDLTSLRTGIMAGAPCPVEVMKKVIARMHMAEVLIAYGQTECSPVNHMTLADDPLEKRVETVGRDGPHLEVKIVDEQGKIVPIGTTGDICTRGYAVMKGYWEDPEKTAETVDAEGWLHSGDLGVMEGEGLLFEVKDTRKQGGEVYGHMGKLEDGVLKVGDRVTAQVNGFTRQATALNHSATHLLHAALRRVAGARWRRIFSTPVAG